MQKTDYYNAILELSNTKTLNTISVRDIAKYLNISTGALYYQFTSKEDLINQMFIYYKQQLDDYINTLDDDPYTLLSSYLSYNFEHNLEFNFVYSSELSSFLCSEALEMSLHSHLNLLSKLGLNYSKDAHITTIIFGTMRAYLLAPSYMNRCDPKQLTNQLVHILNNYKQTL